MADEPNVIFQLAEFSKLASATGGVGFVFSVTLIILLIENRSQAEQGQEYNRSLGDAAILVFLGTTFVTVLSTVLSAASAAADVTLDITALMFIAVVFTFEFWGALLFLGLLLTLHAYNVRNAFFVSKFSLITILAILLVLYNTGLILLNNPNMNWEFSKLYHPDYLIPCFIVQVVILVLGAASRYFPLTAVKSSLAGNEIRAFVMNCIVANALVGIPSGIFFVWPKLNVPQDTVLIFPLVLSFFLAWVIRLIPAETNEGPRQVEIQESHESKHPAPESMA